MGQVRGHHVVWQSWGGDWRDVEIFITQTAHWVRLKRKGKKRNTDGQSSFTTRTLLIQYQNMTFTEKQTKQTNKQKKNPSEMWSTFRAWVVRQRCLQRTDNQEKINKNCIGDFKRLKCHQTLLSELIDGRDCKKCLLSLPQRAESSLNYSSAFSFSCSHSSSVWAITDQLSLIMFQHLKESLANKNQPIQQQHKKKFSCFFCLFFMYKVSLSMKTAAERSLCVNIHWYKSDMRRRKTRSSLGKDSESRHVRGRREEGNGVKDSCKRRARNAGEKGEREAVREKPSHTNLTEEIFYRD